jgi:cellulose synthase/poly-beta-1,6-N-acetylglucosamine synthase-like glycosyltransferase
MVSQHFKTIVPKEVFVTFISSCCELNENNVYIVSNNSYKRAQLSEILQPFLDSILECYHKSKQHYVLRKMNYTRFITVIRQICKANNVPYVSKIRYDRSSYEIIYFICLSKDNLLGDEE